MAKKLRVGLELDYRGKAAVQDFTKDTKKAKTETGGLAAGLRDFTVIATGVVRVLSSMGRAFTETIALAQRQDVAEVRLAVALNNSTQAVERNLGALKKFATERQAITNFGDEWTLELAALGVALGNLGGRDLERAIVAVQDFEAAGKSGRAMIELLGRAASGGTADFTRYGLVIDKNVEGMDKFRAALGQLETKFGGTAEMVGKLATSRLVQLDNTIGDLRETIGRAVSQTQTFQVVLSFISETVKKLDAELSSADGGKKFVAGLDEALMSVLGTAKTVFVRFLLFAADAVEAVGLITTAVLKAASALGLLNKELDEGRIRTLRAEYFKLAESVFDLRKPYKDAAGAMRMLTDEQIASKNKEITAQLAEMRKELHRLSSSSPVRIDFTISGEGLRDLAKKVGDFDIKAMAANLTKSADQVVKEIAAKGFPAGEKFMESLRFAIGEGVAGIGGLFEFDFGKGAAERVEEGIGPWRGGLTGLAGDFDDFIRSLPEKIGEAGDVMVERLEAIDLAEAMRHEEKMIEIGQFWADTLAATMAESILDGGTFDQLMTDMGMDLGALFVGEFTSAVMDPLRAIFGELAKAAAEPFRIIAKAIVDTLLKPVTKVLTEIIGGITAVFAEIVLGEVATTVAASAAVGAIIIANIPLAAQLTAMAAAQSIATLGTATAFAAGAVVAIQAAGLAGAVPFQEEGGLAFPSPGRGGVLVAVAEHEPELILPLSKAKAFLGPSEGADGGLTIFLSLEIGNVGGGISSEDAEEVGELVAEAVDDALHTRLETAGFGRGL
jgi:hypothetical protein